MTRLVVLRSTRSPSRVPATCATTFLLHEMICRLHRNMATHCISRDGTGQTVNGASQEDGRGKGARLDDCGQVVDEQRAASFKMWKHRL